MNIFKKSRKTKDDEDSLGVSNGNEGQPIVKASRGLIWKKKKQEIEEKPAFDLASALPAQNDFRTSLLMPNLSARFSMLREQDDPTTKIGKASDDSVLFPKRASKLNIFNNNNSYLNDIAEVESIRSTVRPPFADDDRKGSTSDGYASDDGTTIMNRTRPSDGNNLFGGRLKLYKIPTTSSIGLTGAKYTYESDNALSSFQQFRLKDKQQRDSDDRTDRSSLPVTETEESDSIRSPSTAFSQNRGTQSSTNSSRSIRPPSTAATSVIFDSPVKQHHNNMPMNKVEERNTNSPVGSIGLATSTNSPTVKDNNTSPKRLSQSRSAVNMRGNYARQSPTYVAKVSRVGSPPLNATSQPLDFSMKKSSRPVVAPPRFQTASPVPHVVPGQEVTLASNVRPNDRGKATAMGLFNKPARHYDEAQFSQRQVQMHEGRISPSSTSSHSDSQASPESARPDRPSSASTTSLPHENVDMSYVSPKADRPASPASDERSPTSSPGQEPTSVPVTNSSVSSKEASVKARVESLIRRQNAELDVLEAAGNGVPQSNEDDSAHVASPSKSPVRETFFDDSDGDQDDSHRPVPAIQSHIPLAPTDVHPALRHSLQGFNFGTEALQLPASDNSQSSASSELHHSAEKSGQSPEPVLSVENVDSPTIANAGLGLSGLIQTHLRHHSDRSLMLPPPSPMLTAEGSRESMVSTTRTATESVKSDPFEFDNERPEIRQSPQELQRPPSPTTAMSERAQQMLGIAAAIRDANAENTPKIGSCPEADTNGGDASTPIIDEANHQRSESTETQREQRCFEEELAARRKRIDENLHNVQERPQSPNPAPVRPGGSISHGFSLPRFPGRSNTGDRSEPQVTNKAMKMLGISSGPRDQSHSRPQDNDQSRHGPRPATAQDNDWSNGRRTPTSRPPYRPGTSHDRAPTSKFSADSSKVENRVRSRSAAASRSTSRNRHVPDFDPSTMPGAFPGSPRLKESPPYAYVQRSETPSNGRTYERSASSAAGQYSDRAGYFASKPFGISGAGNSFSPRPSPRPSPNPATDGFHQQQGTKPMSPPTSALPSPNPAMSGYGNGRSTPVNLPGRATPSGTRKRSVIKHMISVPTFVSSTSSVPLVQLPRDGGPMTENMTSPPIPVMNPRRRGYTAEEQSSNFAPHPAVRPTAPQIVESSVNSEFPSNSSQAAVQPRLRHRLKKSISEGGNIAARAKQQAMTADMERERGRSPNVAVFPNRSATSLGVSRDGGMF